MATDSGTGVGLPPVPRWLRIYFSLCLVVAPLLRLPLLRLWWLYRFMDSYNKFVASFTVCSRGCAACCSIGVDVTTLEAEYIGRFTGRQPVVGATSSRRHRGACPFLSSDATCSIYAVRPFNCRTFHTIDDPRLCSTDEPHVVYGHAGVGYGSVILQRLAWEIHLLNRGQGQRDIRDFFPRAEARKGAQQR